jgi:hypothetical protein
MTPSQIADTALAQIIHDLKDRSGLSNSWDDIDVDIRNEIIATWRGFIVAAIQWPAESADRASGLETADERIVRSDCTCIFQAIDDYKHRDDCPALNRGPDHA